jgi:hypothetical protein
MQQPAESRGSDSTQSESPVAASKPATELAGPLPSLPTNLPAPPASLRWIESSVLERFVARGAKRVPADVDACLPSITPKLSWTSYYQTTHQPVSKTVHHASASSAPPSPFASSQVRRHILALLCKLPPLPNFSNTITRSSALDT